MVVSHEVRAVQEYSTDLPYISLTLSRSANTSSAEGCCDWLSYAEPSPTWSHGTMCGSGVHGWWLETRSISAITGFRCVGASSRLPNSESVYWSGIGA